MNQKISIVGLMLLSACGCSGMNNTQQGALSGGAIGTGMGALIGHATGNTGAGALIGGVLGTGVGATIGRDEDRREERRTAREIAHANAVAARQMRLDDVVQMAQRRTPDEIIIQQIDSTHSIFNLSTQDIFFLQDQGVSRNVISFMQTRRGPRAVMVEQSRPVERVVIVEQPPQYGVGVRIGGR